MCLRRVLTGRKRLRKIRDIGVQCVVKSLEKKSCKSIIVETVVRVEKVPKKTAVPFV